MEEYDPILTEVHRVKDALGAKYGYDVRKLAKALRAAQKRSGAKVVDFSGPRSGGKKRTVVGGRRKAAAKR